MAHRRLIVHNDAAPFADKHQTSRTCRAMPFFQHPPTEPFNEHGCRNFNKDIEDEAKLVRSRTLIFRRICPHCKTGMAEEAIKFTVLVKRWILCIIVTRRKRIGYLGRGKYILTSQSIPISPARLHGAHTSVLLGKKWLINYHNCRQLIGIMPIIIFWK